MEQFIKTILSLESIDEPYRLQIAGMIEQQGMDGKVVEMILIALGVEIDILLPRLKN